MARRRGRRRRDGTPLPRWSTSTRGVVRTAVLVASLTAAVGVALLGDPSEDAVLWVVLGGCGLAGIASAARLVVMPILPADGRLAALTGDADSDQGAAVRQSRQSASLIRPTLGDCGWSVLIVVGAATVRSVARVTVFGGDPAELLLPILMVLVWLLAYLIGGVMGLLVSLAGASAGRLAAAHRRGLPVAPEWWAVPVVFGALAVFAVTALLSVTLLDAPSSRGLGGFLALVLWDFHGLEGWDLVLAWTTRLSGIAIIASIAVLIAGRLRAGRMRAGRMPHRDADV